jgi:hypothetical protein
MDVASESMVDSVRVSVSVIEVAVGDDGRPEVVEEFTSSMEAGFGLILDGVPVLDLRLATDDFSSTLDDSRGRVFDPADDWRSDFPCPMVIDFPLCSLFLIPSAAFCKSDFLRSMFTTGSSLTVRTLFFCRDSFVAVEPDFFVDESSSSPSSVKEVVVAFSSSCVAFPIVVNGGLGGAPPVESGSAPSFACGFDRSRSVGSGV